MRNFNDLVPSTCSRILGLDRPLRILEVGCAGGWFTKALLESGHDVFAVEGVTAGLKCALERGVSAEKLMNHDVRQSFDLQTVFDIVICTEIAEHIEPPFAALFIQNLVRHADLIWFSFEPPNTNEAAYHHPNEMPLKFWENLFAYFGYRMIPIPLEIRRRIDNRGTYICLPFSMRQNVFPDVEQPVSRVEISEGAEKDRLYRMHRRLRRVGRLIPPLIFDCFKPFLEKALLPRSTKKGETYSFVPARLSNSGSPEFHGKTLQT